MGDALFDRPPPHFLNGVYTRLVELLTDKIHLFDTVLGESDEILGAIEDWMDF